MMMSFRLLDAKFRKSCTHIRLLNSKIDSIQIRYERAYSNGHRTFRYSHRLKLATLEGLRNMYYEYACRRADELERLQDDLMERGLISEQDESDMDHSDR